MSDNSPHHSFDIDIKKKLDKDEEDPHYRVIPRNIRHSFLMHAKEGRKAGGFVEAVLANDFATAVSRADTHNINILRNIMWYVCNEIPAPCWGSREQVKQWRQLFEDVP